MADGFGFMRVAGVEEVTSCRSTRCLPRRKANLDGVGGEKWDNGGLTLTNWDGRLGSKEQHRHVRGDLRG